MTTKTQLFLALWLEARTRFTLQLANITDSDLKKRLSLLIALLLLANTAPAFGQNMSATK